MKHREKAEKADASEKADTSCMNDRNKERTSNKGKQMHQRT